MKCSQNVILSLEILGAHRLRTSLSLLGIIVGVAAFLVMVSAGKGAEDKILAQIRSMGTNLLIVSPGQTKVIGGRTRQKLDHVTTLIPEDAEAIVANCPSVEGAAPAVQEKLGVRWEAFDTNTSVVGITPDGFRIRSLEVSSGSLFNEIDNRARRRIAVLGPTVAQDLFGEEEPLGQRIRLGRVLFEVIGVTEPKGTDTGGTDLDDVIFVPLETAMRRLMNVSYVETIYVRAKDQDSLQAAEEEIAALLRTRHRLGSKPDDFTIQNQLTLLEVERGTARSMTLLIASVAGLSLLVGGFGILAVMLITIRERTREIGLRRALGAEKRDIRNQFLTEAVLLSGTGGLLGILAGVAGIWGTAEFGLWPAVFSWEAIALSFSISVLIGIVFGVYPATRAAQLQPVEALRAE